MNATAKEVLEAAITEAEESLADWIKWRDGGRKHLADSERQVKAAENRLHDLREAIAYDLAAIRIEPDPTILAPTGQ